MSRRQNQTFKKVQSEIKKKSKINSNLKAEDQGCYVDPARNTAVTLDTKELSSALKNFENQKVTNLGVNVVVLYSVVFGVLLQGFMWSYFVF